MSPPLPRGNLSFRNGYPYMDLSLSSELSLNGHASGRHSQSARFLGEFHSTSISLSLRVLTHFRLSV